MRRSTPPACDLDTRHKTGTEGPRGEESAGDRSSELVLEGVVATDCANTGSEPPSTAERWIALSSERPISTGSWDAGNLSKGRQRWI